MYHGSLRHLGLVAAAAFYATAVFGQDPNGWLLGQPGAPVGSFASGPMSVNTAIHEPGAPFVIGQDNLGFANLSGAITIDGMSGNCYTMATVARLFHEAATYRPLERVNPSFTSREVAVTLRSPSFPSPSFAVRGHENLYQLSTPPTSGDPEAWMEGWARYRAGLEDSPPQGPTPDDVDGIVTLYQMISTIHYMHYVQFQSQHLLGAAVRREVQGGASVPQVMASTLQRIRSDLDAGRLPLVCIFNPRPSVFFGHVVLAYKLDDRPGEAFSDVYVYDSNVQYEGSRHQEVSRGDEAFLRVHDDGRLEIKLAATDGSVRDLSIYDGDEWFEDEEATVLVVLDDLEADRRLRVRLADKIDGSRENTGYLLAVGDLLEDLTGESPSESSLFENVRDFVHQVSRVEGERLPADADVGQLNDFLARHADRAARTMFPLALPDGVEVSDVALRFDPADASKLTLRSTLTLSRSVAVDAVIEAIRTSALVGNEDLAEMVEGVAQAFEGQVLKLTTEVEITKGRTRGRMGDYGPLPVLKSSHLVVGDLQGGSMQSGDDHRIEISEAAIQDFVRWILRRQNVIGRRFDYEYEIPVLGDREAYVRVSDVVVDTREPFFGTVGRLGIRLEWYGFAGVMGEDRGVNYESDDYTTLWLKMEPGSQRNYLDVRGYFSGDHEVRAGIPSWLGLDTVLSAVAGAIFEDMEDEIDELLEGELDRYVELVGDGPRLRDLEIDTEEVSLDVEEFTVDIDETLARIFGGEVSEVPVALTGVDLLDDRIVIRFRND